MLRFHVGNGKRYSKNWKRLYSLVDFVRPRLVIGNDSLSTHVITFQYTGYMHYAAINLKSKFLDEILNFWLLSNRGNYLSKVLSLYIGFPGIARSKSAERKLWLSIACLYNCNSCQYLPLVILFRALTAAAPFQAIVLHFKKVNSKEILRSSLVL